MGRIDGNHCGLDGMDTRNLDGLIAQWEGDSSLFEPGRLRERFEVLDELDACCGETAAGEPGLAQMAGRALAVRKRLEAVNSAIYQAIRSEVRQGARPDTLLRWVDLCRNPKETPNPGLGYDCLDELVSGVLQLREPGGPLVHAGPEEVFYQPTPVRHILRMVQISGLSEADVLVDVGSGLGHVAMLASILTRARGMGIEKEAAYEASARECAERLGLSRVMFVHKDARDADFGAGTVFYLYTPFTGALLQTVLGKLRRESGDRAIRVCTLGPCTAVVAQEPWLTGNGEADVDGIACFWAGEISAFPLIPQ